MDVNFSSGGFVDLFDVGAFAADDGSGLGEVDEEADFGLFV